MEGEAENSSTVRENLPGATQGHEACTERLYTAESEASKFVAFSVWGTQRETLRDLDL